MPSSNKTEHLELDQWVGADSAHIREDLNQDFFKIDTWSQGVDANANALTNRVDSLETDNTANKADIISLRQKDTEHDLAIAAIESSISSIETTVGGLQTELTNLGTTLSAFIARFNITPKHTIAAADLDITVDSGTITLGAAVGAMYFASGDNDGVYKLYGGIYIPVTPRSDGSGGYIKMTTKDAIFSNPPSAGYTVTANGVSGATVSASGVTANGVVTVRGLYFNVRTDGRIEIFIRFLTPAARGASEISAISQPSLYFNEPFGDAPETAGVETTMESFSMQDAIIDAIAKMDSTQQAKLSSVMSANR